MISNNHESRNFCLATKYFFKTKFLLKNSKPKKSQKVEVKRLVFGIKLTLKEFYHNFTKQNVRFRH